VKTLSSSKEFRHVCALFAARAGCGASPGPAVAAAAGAADTAAGATDAAAGAVDTANARAALCSSQPGPDAQRAIEGNDTSIVWLDSIPPPADTGDSPADTAVPTDPGAHGGRGQRQKRQKRPVRASIDQADPDDINGTEHDGAPANKRPKKDSPARNYRKAKENNQFLEKFPTNSGNGYKLGSAITMAAMIIQGPYPKEDRRSSKDHERHVRSGMLNVCNEATLASFVAMGEVHEQEKISHCLQRVKSSRVTLQRAIQNLKKFINAFIGTPAGIGPEWRGKHLAYALILKLSTDFVFVAAHFGINAGQSILDHWKTEDKRHKYK
jgi:hypothetical protein